MSRHIALCAMAISSSFTVACGDSTMAPSSEITTASIHSAQDIGNASLLPTLGGRIFTDPTLSLKQNQSCASCHDMNFGFTSPNTTVNANGAVMFGSVSTRFGNRKPPSAAYATQAPVQYFDADDDTFVGGNFWDGRATGMRLGSAAAEQSQFPFVNPVEQGLPDAACVLYRITKSTYLTTYTSAYDATLKNIVWPSNTNSLCQIEGSTIPLSPAVRATVMSEFDRVARAIAAFEDSPMVSPFTSKYDYYLAGQATLTAQEAEGRQLYEGQAGCAGCHPNAGVHALMTDYTFDNIGVPANPKNPSLLSDVNYRDLGLGGSKLLPDRYGQQKVATLRNLDKRLGTGVKSYMHNGVFKSIEQVVHFYNTRDVLPSCRSVASPTFGVNCWPDPEVVENVNRVELGDLGMSAAQEAALVTYLKTLTDGYVVARSTGPVVH